MAVNWDLALQVFYVGFGGVFLCLLLLQALTNLSSFVFRQINKIANNDQS